MPAAPAPEALEPGPFLTENDPAVPAAREVPLPGARTVIVPESVASGVRPGLHELYALTEERFVYLEAQRLAVIDAEAGRGRPELQVDDEARPDFADIADFVAVSGEIDGSPV